MSVLFAVGATVLSGGLVLVAALKAVIFFAAFAAEVVVCWLGIHYCYRLLFLLHVLVESLSDQALLV